jgi:hypothetical protein
MVQFHYDENTPSSERGATLVGLVMALLTMGLLAASGYYIFGPGKTVGAMKSSAINFARIQKAIAVFAARNERLPCAADAIATGSNAGIENCATAASNRIISWKTIGLQETDAIDPWGNMISYHPDSALSTGTPFNGPPTANGTLIILDAAGGAVVATDAAYVLISHGVNGLGAWTKGRVRKALPSKVDESENTNGDTTFVFKSYDSATATYFDDLTAYQTAVNICSAAGITDHCTGADDVSDEESDADPVLAAAISFTTNDLKRFVATKASSSQNLGAVSIKYSKKNKPNSVTMVTSSGNYRWCLWWPDSINLKNSIVRTYFEFQVESDSNGDEGDGFTFAFLPGSTNVSTGTVCGDYGGGIGFATGHGYSLPSPNFAVEYDDMRTAANSDPTNNHIAIVLNGSSVHSGSNPTCASGGCYSGPTSDWLEDQKLHKMRIELQYGVAPCTSTQAYMKVFVWKASNNGNTAICNNCSDLSVNYASNDASAAIASCISLTSAQDTIKFGWTAAGGGNSSWVKIRTFGLNSFIN